GEGATGDDDWPPPVVGQVRLRLLTEETCADLRGPTACQLQTPEEVQATIAKLGPDPLVYDVEDGEERFTATVRRKPTPIGLLLMDQSVVSGIGNVYRAEMLFRAR
ncbi:DNA glycosylase, partial [Bacillus cereus]